MAKSSLIDRILSWFGYRQAPAAARSEHPVGEIDAVAAARDRNHGAQVTAAEPILGARILQILASTYVEELSCDEVYELLDQVAEMQAAGQDLAAVVPLVDKHLKLCGECREEYEALLSMIGAQAAMA